jgi:hypothetical protein
MINKTCRPQTFAQMALAAGLLSLAFTSCKPEDKTKTAPAKRDYQLTSGTTINATQVDADIKSFYQKMKNLQSSTSTENITVDDALFLIEGTYNKYVAERQFNCDVIPYEFTVKVPANSDGTLNMKKVSEAFYTIKSNMLAKKNALGGSTIGVETFDMTVAERPTGIDGQGYANFGVITIFKRPNPGFPIDMTQWCNDNFHEADDHVWSAGTQSAQIQGGVLFNGQATIDHANKILVPGSQNNTLPGAASSLRAKGVGNYQGFYCKSMMCGYFVNLDSVQDYYIAPAGAAPCQYVSMGIPSYTNVGTWKTDVYKIEPVDPNKVYKKWLTTPMMNYYLAGIPAIITANIVPGKTFANFHVTTIIAFGGITDTTDIWAHHYKIYSGDFVATPGGDCTGKLELGYL